MMPEFRHLPIILALTALIAGSACSAQPAAAPKVAPLAVADTGCTRDVAGVEPFLRPAREERFAPRIAALDAVLKGRHADVLVMGDSIIQRWPQDVLERAFPGKTVIDVGIGGERVADELYRLQAALAAQPANDAGLNNFRAQSPKIVVTLIGTNDLRAKSACYIADGKVQIAATLRALYPGARIVLLDILPRGNPQGQFAALIAQVNRMVTDTARKTKAFETADIGAAYACKPQQTCDVAIPKNFVHPSDKGYALLTTALRDYLARSR